MKNVETVNEEYRSFHFHLIWCKKKSRVVKTPRPGNLAQG